MFSVQLVYKNIITLILIILFLFFLSNEKKINEIFVQKGSLRYLFILLLIYLVYHQFNLALLFIPFLLFQFVYHPKFKSIWKGRFAQHPYLLKMKKFLEEIQFTTPSPQESIDEVEEEMIVETPKIIQEQKKDEKISFEEMKKNISMEVIPEIKKEETEERMNIEHFELDQENQQSTPLHQLEEEHDKSGDKTLSIQELEELYNTIQNELKELDKKNISL